MLRSTRTAIALLLAVALSVAACGGTEGSSTTVTEPVAGTSAPSETTPGTSATTSITAAPDAGNSGSSDIPEELQGQEVVAAVYGGSLDALEGTIHPLFEQETGIEAVAVPGMDPTLMYQMVEQDAVEWDVVVVGPEQTAVTEEWFEPIDYSIVTNTEGVPENAQFEYGIASDYYSMVLAYRTDVYTENPPQTWEDFWNVEDFPGRRTLPRRTIDIVELALLGDGVDSEDMYPIDVERAMDAIERIDPDIATYWTGGNEPLELLLTGEVDMAAVWVTRVANTLSEADPENMPPIDYTWNQHLIAQDVVGIPKGAPHAEAAQHYINFRMRPDIQGIMLNLTPVGPSNANASQYVQPERQQFNPSSDENLPKGHFRDPEFWIENIDEIDQTVADFLGA